MVLGRSWAVIFDDFPEVLFNDFKCFVLWIALGGLGLFWGGLGASWGGLGAVLGRLGAVFGGLGTVLCSLQPVLGRSWALLEQSWVVLGRYGVRILVSSLVLQGFGTPWTGSNVVPRVVWVMVDGKRL